MAKMIPIQMKSTVSNSPQCTCINLCITLNFHFFSFRFYMDLMVMKLYQYVYSDRSRMRDILNLHLVRDRLNTERIRQQNLHSVSQS